MNAKKLIALGAGLQLMKDRLAQDRRWTPNSFVDDDGVRWELTDVGWRSVLS